jgi:DNA-binding transcriptional MerR regulator
MMPWQPSPVSQDEEAIYLTPAQVQDLLQVSEKTLRRWRQEGVGPPFVRIDRVIRYRRAAVLDWLQQQERTQDDEA